MIARSSKRYNGLAKSIFDASVQNAIQEVPFVFLIVEPTMVTLIREGYIISHDMLGRTTEFLLLLSDKVSKVTASNNLSAESSL